MRTVQSPARVAVAASVYCPLLRKRAAPSALLARVVTRSFVLFRRVPRSCASIREGRCGFDAGADFIIKFSSANIARKGNYTLTASPDIYIVIRAEE